MPVFDHINMTEITDKSPIIALGNESATMLLVKAYAKGDTKTPVGWIIMWLEDEPNILDHDEVYDTWQEIVLSLPSWKNGPTAYLVKDYASLLKHLAINVSFHKVAKIIDINL